MLPEFKICTQTCHHAQASKFEISMATSESGARRVGTWSCEETSKGRGKAEKNVLKVKHYNRITNESAKQENAKGHGACFVTNTSC